MTQPILMTIQISPEEEKMLPVSKGKWGGGGGVWGSENKNKDIVSEFHKLVEHDRPGDRNPE